MRRLTVGCGTGATHLVTLLAALLGLIGLALGM